MENWGQVAGAWVPTAALPGHMRGKKKGGEKIFSSRCKGVKLKQGGGGGKKVAKRQVKVKMQTYVSSTHRP